MPFNITSEDMSKLPKELRVKIAKLYTSKVGTYEERLRQAERLRNNYHSRQ